jgi:hypothetical protein
MNLLNGSGTMTHWMFRDHLDYAVAAGRWRISPALDLSWQHISEKNHEQGMGRSSGFSSTFEGDAWAKGSLFYLTPAVGINLGRAFEVQAGTMVNASRLIEVKGKRVFPFAAATVDLLHLTSDSGGASLRLFGSWARRSLVFINDYELVGFTGSGAISNLSELYELTGGYGTINGGVIQAPPSINVPVPPNYWTWVAGAGYVTANGRLTLDYSFERRNFAYLGTLYANYYELHTSTFHHVDVRVKVIDSKAAHWLTGFNVTLLRSKADSNVALAAVELGDTYPNAYSWTGGWVNRLQVGAFTAGLDLLYWFNERPLVGANGNGWLFGPKNNSVLLPNTYVGYRWKLAGDRVLDLFMDSRGLVRSKSNDLLDDRRYYTLGGSFSF